MAVTATAGMVRREELRTVPGLLALAFAISAFGP
jgi:hypothetical protein